jgi:hypothetical protein
MRLTADRIELDAGERIRGVMIVHPSQVSVIVSGGLPHLANEITDVGFRDVEVFLEPQPSWLHASDVAVPGDLEWLLWFEGFAKSTASLSRDLTEDLRIADAWSALDEPHEFRGFLHPYAVAWAAITRGEGALRAFGSAYPVEVQQ